jgi:Uma2 family endonuclease
MIAQAQASRTYSPAEYLELEVASETRHEYINGEIVPMTGGMPNHNQILLNLAGALNFALRQQPYRVFAADQRLWIPQHRIYTYPDVMVIQGALAYQEGRRDTLINPRLIIEVLSKSTRDYDQGDKFAAYRTIPTFQEYVLVDQYRCQVSRYAKTGEKKWTFQEYDGLENAVEFASFPFTIALNEIYDKVEFEPTEQADSNSG